MGRPKNVVVERVYRPDAAACEAALAALLKDAPRKTRRLPDPPRPTTPRTRKDLSMVAPRNSLPDRRTIDAAKSAVPTIDLADRLCGPGGLRRVGKEWVGLCPLPDHGEKSPSFAVSKEKNLWYCHGCVHGGDAVRLAALAWDAPDDKTAAGWLLLEFGFEVPQRPAQWFDKQKRQHDEYDEYGRL